MKGKCKMEKKKPKQYKDSNIYIVISINDVELTHFKSTNYLEIPEHDVASTTFYNFNPY